jgi:hypothetical protein
MFYKNNMAKDWNLGGMLNYSVIKWVSVYNRKCYNEKRCILFTNCNVNFSDYQQDMAKRTVKTMTDIV